MAATARVSLRARRRGRCLVSSGGWRTDGAEKARGTAAILSAGVASTAIRDSVTAIRTRNAEDAQGPDFDDKCNACMVLRVRICFREGRCKLSHDDSQVNLSLRVGWRLRHKFTARNALSFPHPSRAALWGRSDTENRARFRPDRARS